MIEWLLYFFAAVFFFSLGVLFSQTDKGKEIILMINISLDALNIKSRKKQ